MGQMMDKESGLRYGRQLILNTFAHSSSPMITTSYMQQFCTHPSYLIYTNPPTSCLNTVSDVGLRCRRWYLCSDGRQTRLKIEITSRIDNSPSHCPGIVGTDLGRKWCYVHFSITLLSFNTLPSFLSRFFPYFTSDVFIFLLFHDSIELSLLSGTSAQENGHKDAEICT
jgi:hypothetical protein